MGIGVTVKIRTTTEFPFLLNLALNLFNCYRFSTNSGQRLELDFVSSLGIIVSRLCLMAQIYPLVLRWGKLPKNLIGLFSRPSKAFFYEMVPGPR